MNPPGQPSLPIRFRLYGAAALLNLAVMGPVYAGFSVFYFRDVLTNYTPYLAWFSGRVASGELPFWMDGIFGGMPFWGDPVQGVLYPLRWLMVPLRGLHPAHACSVFIGIHYLLAHAGYIRLLSNLGVRPAIAFLAAAGLVYGTVGLGLHAAIQFLAGFALMGWLGAALLDHLRNPTVRTMTGLALWVALLVTTGDLQSVYLVSLFALGVSRPWIPGGRRTFALTFGGLALAAFLTAAILVPGVELSLNSSRGESNTLSLVQAWSWNPVRLVEWIAPGLFDPPPEASADMSGISRPVVAGLGLYFLRAHPGMVVLLLLPWLVSAARGEIRIRCLLALAAISLLTAGGEYFGFYELLWNLLPGWKQFRFPERFLLSVVISLWLASALVMEKLASGVWRPSRALPAVIFCGVLLMLSLAGMTGGGSWAGMPAEVAALKANPLFREHALSAFRWGLLLLAGGMGFLWLLWRDDRRWLPTFGALVALEFGVAGYPVLRTIPAELFPMPPGVMRLLANRSDERIVPLRIQMETGQQVLPVQRAREVGAALFWQGLAGDLVLLTPFSIPGGYNSSRPLDHELATRTIPPLNGLRLQSLDYVAAVPGWTPPVDGFECAGPEGEPPLRLCRFVESLQPVRAPRHWKQVNDHAVLEGLLSDPDWNPGEVEYLGPRLSGHPMPAVPVLDGTDEGAILHAIHWTPEIRRIEVERDSPGPIILRDNYFPGWNVYVNGKRSDTLVANGFQLAAWVPAGRSTVEFHYEPLSLAIGLWISGLTVLAMIGWYARHRRSRMADQKPT